MKQSLLKKLSQIKIGGIKRIDIILFTKHLSVTLKSGLTLIEGIDIVRDQTQGKMKRMLTNIQESIRNGETFHFALEAYPKYFSPFYVNMIKTSEVSGNLEENLNRLATHLTKAERLRKKIKSAMIYPGFIITAMIGIGIIIATFVLPKILPLFENFDVELPATTKALIFVATQFEERALSIIIVIVSYSSFTAWFLKQNFMKPILHRIYLKIPTLKTIIKNINIQRFTSTLSVLLKSGLTIDESLKIISNAMDNRVYRKRIKAMIPEIESGTSIETAISKYPELFPSMISRMVGVGEKTGSLDDTLEYLGGYYEELVDDTVKNLSTIIEPLILIVVGVMVGVVALSIIQPMSNLTGSI